MYVVYMTFVPIKALCGYDILGMNLKIDSYVLH
jgi:hypothetical protein